MKRISLLFTLWLSLALSLTAQQPAPVPSFIRDSLDSYVAKALKAWDLPGVAVAVVKDGQVVLMEGYGYLESGKPGRVDENTLFMIASNTKAFTGTSLALLEYEKKCSMDDKVQRWLPEFTMKDPWVAKEASLADLVSHRLGMETFQGDFMYWTSDLSRSEVIQKMGQLTPAFAFRNKWGYTNAAFVAAGVCIEKISGQSWDSFIESRFLKPLNMSRTLTLSAQIAQATNVAKPHTYNAQNQLVSIPWCQIDNIAPCASLSSSASDMTHWLIAQLERGVYEGKQVIPAEVIDRTRDPLSILNYGSGKYSLYGMGWEIETRYGKQIISHTGGVNGILTSVTLLPEERLGILVFTNSDQNNFFQALKWQIAEAYLDKPWRNISELYQKRAQQGLILTRTQLKQQQDSVALHLAPALSLKSYCGTYEHAIYGTLDIRQEGDHLLLTPQHHPTLANSKLEPLGGNRFLCTYTDPVFATKVIPFTVTKGKVSSLHLTVNDFIEYGGYDFVKRK